MDESLHRLHAGGIAPLFCERCVVILLADCLIGYQRLGAGEILLRIFQRRLRLREIGLRLLKRCRERQAVDDEQQIVFLDRGAVGVSLALENTANARANLYGVDRFGLTDVLFEHRNRRRRDLDHRHLRRRRLRRRTFLAARR